jgi:hypothetical protein
VDCGVRRRGFHGDWAYSINVRRPSPISRHRVTRVPAAAAFPESRRGIARDKVFGLGRRVPLDRNAKVRVMMVARALMRRQEKGKAYGKVTAKALAMLTALLWRFHKHRQVLPELRGDRRRRRVRPLDRVRGAPCP